MKIYNKKEFKFYSKIIVFFSLIIISLNFIITGDDYFFLNTGFEVLIDSVFFNINNGRYLGNFCGIFISNLYKSQTLQYIRYMIMGTGLFLIILLCYKLSNLKINESFIISALIILIAPSNLYREVYSWTAGYMNYLMPVLLVFTILYILKKYLISNKEVKTIDIFFIIILGFCSQLFVEHITIYMVIMSLILFIISVKKNLNIKRLVIPLFISNLIGAIIMFSAKGYRSINSGDTYRNIEISSIYSLIKISIFNLLEMCKYIVIDNTFLSVTILLVCVFLIKKQQNNLIKSKKNVIYNILYWFVFLSIIYIFTVSFINLLEIPRTIRLIKYGLDIVVTFIFCTILFYTIHIVDFKDKYKLRFCYLSIILVSGPLIIVSPIGTRCFFICYAFLAIILMDMISYICRNKLVNLNYIKYISIGLLSIVLIQKMYIYYSIHSVYEERVNYIEQQMNEEKEVIAIPSLPFSKYVQNDTSYFIGQYYYYEKTNDIKFKMIPYKKWVEESN